MAMINCDTIVTDKVHRGTEEAVLLLLSPYYIIFPALWIHIQLWVYSTCISMSEPAEDWISNPLEGHEPGELGDMEKWWVERQKALELAGYMLRPRYHPDWKPSWTGTGKYL